MEDLYLAERYKVLHKIGSGGGGEVYAIFDRHLQKNLALKIFSPEDDNPADDESFFNEYLLIHKLTGKSLVEAHDYGYTGNNHPFYTMELLPEGNIDEQLRNKDIQTKLEICQQLCMSLAFLHFLDLIHNDLKPENIKLIDENGDIRVKLLDLGLSVNFDPDSPANRLSGTVEYMAPELFESRNPNQKSDIYSLGVIFYKLITNKLPFSSDDPLLVISDKLEKPAPAINPKSGAYPAEFIELTANLLDRDPSKRPESAFEAANIIGNITGISSFKLDFGNILGSVVGINLARQLEKMNLDSGKDRNFLFNDEFQMRKFILLLKAHIQCKFMHAEIIDGDPKDDSQSAFVCPKSNTTASINIIRCAPGKNISDKCLEGSKNAFNVSLNARFGNMPDESGFRNIEIDLLPDMERWLCEKNLNQEVIDKLQRISSHDTSFLSEILSTMQEMDILRFNGIQWDCDSQKFVSFPIPSTLQGKAVACLDYLPNDRKNMIRNLAIMRYDFDRHFARKFLNGLTDDPDGVLADFASAKIIVRRDEYFSFKDEFLRVGLVNTIDPQELKRLHLRAAGIIESSGGVRQDERVLNLAHNYTHAGELDEAVKWTLKATQSLIAREEYRVAIKMVSAALRLAEKASIPKAVDYTASLLAVRGDIENKLGVSRQSLRTFSRIVRMKKKLTDRNLLARAYKNAGDLYKAACNYTKGLKALRKALPIYIELDNKAELSHTYNNIGNIHWIGSKIDLALENYAQALKLQEELNLEKELASTLNNMGSCYIIKNQLEKTIEYYKRSIEIKKRINDRPELARTYNNLGAVYHELGRIPEALIYLYDALKINREIDSRRELLFNLDNITACEIALGRFQKAESYMAEGLQLSQELEAFPMQAMFLQHKSMILFHTGVFGQAEIVLDGAHKIVERITDQNLEFEIQCNFCRLYLAMNASEAFWSMLKNAQTLAQNIEDKKANITVSILKCRGMIEFDRDYKNARLLNMDNLKLAQEIKSEQLICKILLNELALTVESGEVSDIDTSEINTLITKPVNQTLKQDYYFLLARQAMDQKLYDRAASLLSEAGNLAEIQGNRNLLWKIKYLQGRNERALLNYEESYICFKQAVTILKSLAQTITTPDYLKSFLNNPTSTLLKKEIVDLAGRMGQK